MSEDLEAKEPRHKRSNGPDDRSAPAGHPRSDAEAPAPAGETVDTEPNDPLGTAPVAPGAGDNETKEAPDPQERELKKRADLVRKAMQQAKGALGENFHPDPKLLGQVLEVLDPASHAELNEIAANAAGQTPPPAGKIMRLLRVSGLEVSHWATNLASEIATIQALEPKRATAIKADKLWKRIAHKSGVTVNQIHALAEKATLDEAAFLNLFIPKQIIKHLGIPTPPSVENRSVEILAMFRRNSHVLGSNNRGLFAGGKVVKGIKEQTKTKPMVSVPPGTEEKN